MNSETESKHAEQIVLTMDDLRETAASSERGLTTLYIPGQGFQTVKTDSPEAQAQMPGMVHEIVSVSDDLLFARTDMTSVPDEAYEQQWKLDFRGWMFLHIRLEGLAREVSPDGRVSTLGGHSFLLSASTSKQPATREVLGSNWRTVGIACKPSFFRRELGIPGDDLPEDVSRFQAGDEDSEIWYADELSHEMIHVANSLLHPEIHKSVRPIYLRAKMVELMCLAIDRLRRPTPVVATKIKLSKRDIDCLFSARKILDESRRPPTLEALARTVGINRNKLAMGFKHVFGFDELAPITGSCAWPGLMNGCTEFRRHHRSGCSMKPATGMPGVSARHSRPSSAYSHPTSRENHTRNRSDASPILNDAVPISARDEVPE